MKHLKLLLLLSLAILPPPLLSGGSQAAPVKPDRARAAALDFFGTAATTSSLRGGQPRLEMVWNGETTATRSASDPAFFVYNRTDAPGFVIISGDDRLPSLLAYSFENSFRTEGMPEHIRSWFSAWRAMILRVRSDGGSRPVKWDAAPRAGEMVRYLPTADWSQGPPYNDACPIFSGHRTLTGCVQTAAAIVIKYNRWPDHISGTVPSYTTATLGLTVPARTLRDYNYELLSDAYDSGYSAAQAAEVARLMADLGVMCQADYGLDGTGAYTRNMLKAMVSYMRYDKGAKEVFFRAYSDAEWGALLRQEIDADRPVLYAGAQHADGGGAHQYVVDGYDDRGRFHFNWGWGGFNNGLYSFEDADYEFKYFQSAIVGLKKDPAGTSDYAPVIVLTSLNYAGEQYRGITTAQTVFRSGESFEVLFGGVGNVGVNAFTGTVKLVVCNRGGTIREDLTEEIGIQNLESFMQLLPGNFTCTVRNPIAPGDRIRAYFRVQDGDEWEMMRRYQDEVQQEILLAEDTEEPLDPTQIAAATSLAFDRATRRMMLRTMAYAGVRLTNPTGQTVFDAVAGVDAIAVDLSPLAAGEYTLTIGFDHGEPYALRIVL